VAGRRHVSGGFLHGRQKSDDRSRRRQANPPRRNDAGNGANETPDGLDANNEALRNAVENTPAETSTVDIELTSVFDRAYCAPKI
jgi:hypothetical protein